MSVWGKFIVSAAGFALGGPIGALIGVVAGHAIDKIKTRQKLPEESALKQIGFTVGVIVLSAKMAKLTVKLQKKKLEHFKTR